ncbi:FkbM family methyltransferase, partial [Rhizobium phaseoli]
MPGKPWLTAKYWSRRLRKARNAAASRIFDTRFGRRLLIENIGPRVVSMTVDAGDHLMTFSPADYIGRKVFRKGHFERDAVD